MFSDYGLDAFRTHPGVSIVLSLLLICGQFNFGRLSLKYLFKDSLDDSLILSQSLIVGAACLCVLLYPVCLFYSNSHIVLLITAVVLLALSIFLFVGLVRDSRANILVLKDFLFERNNAWSVAGLCLLSLYFLLALLPVTNADSLDYHVGVALGLLNNGYIQATPEWFHSRIAGNGEVLNALGFSLGAEQFGSLLQWSAIVSVVGLISWIERNSETTEKWGGFLQVLFLASPVLVFLVYSVKPQLLPIGMTTLAFYLLFFRSEATTRRQDIQNFSLICLLCMTASQMKFSMMLTGGLVGLLAFYRYFLKKKRFVVLPISLVSFSIIVLPVIYWKKLYFGGSFIDSFISPLPGHWPGTDAFELMLRSYKDSTLPFPISLAIPNNVGTITTIIGVGVLAIAFLRKPDSRVGSLSLLCIFLVFVLAVLLGPSTTRSFVEPYSWALLLLAARDPSQNFYAISPVFSKLAAMQSALVVAVCVVGISTGFGAYFSTGARADLMQRQANGYSLVAWLDRSLPEAAVVLSEHRSLAVMPRKSVSFEWSKYANLSSPEIAPYLDRVKAQGVSHLLLLGNIEAILKSAEWLHFQECANGEPIGPGKGQLTTRNPFNQGNNYDAWLIPVSSQNLPACYRFDVDTGQNLSTQ